MPADPKPSAWAMERAYDVVREHHATGPHVAPDVGDIARALDAAREEGILEGHRRAVEGTAIASIHKAVAAERAEVVAWLRKDAQRLIEEALPHAPCYPAIALRQSADAIKRGDHHNPKEPK
jgi:hypothetical protein